MRKQPLSELAHLWGQCTENIQNKISSQQFDIWIKPLELDEQTCESLRLLAPNHFVVDWVKSKYLSQIQETAKSVMGDEFNVEIEVPEHHQIRVITQSQKNEKSVTENPSVGEKNGGSIPGVKQLKKTHGRSALAEFSGAAKNNKTVVKPSDFEEKTPASKPVNNRFSHLNHNYTFDNFVRGKSNEIALAAAQHVATLPKDSYNPLFIYGPTALGKTHLMCAVGHQLHLNRPDLKVCYLRAEQFVSDMVRSIQMDAIDDFKNFYRSVNVLLIDDIQFFAKKTRSQEEFFHTYNTLVETQQQMIFTCDRFPKKIDGLEERLKSRFGWGLTVEIEPPELETRVAILQKKAHQSSIDLSYEAAFFIAERVRSNVRELEGALKRVAASSMFGGGSPITIDLVRDSLKDLFAVHQNLITIESIQQIVADFYSIKVSEMNSQRRKQNLVKARQVAMFLAKELTKKSLPEIGERFGGRDHTTVLHSYKKIKNQQSTSEQIKEDIKLLTRTLTS